MDLFLSFAQADADVVPAGPAGTVWGDQLLPSQYSISGWVLKPLSS